VLPNCLSLPRQDKTARASGEFDPRRDCLRSYTDLCVSMRMPCRNHLRISASEKWQEPKSKEPEEEEEEDVPFWKKPHPIRDHASPAKIKAISRALVGTLRTIKSPPPPPKSWREKYDSNGNPVGVPWWQCSEDTPPPSLRPKLNLP
jgi:hypothetical protein